MSCVPPCPSAESEQQADGLAKYDPWTPATVNNNPLFARVWLDTYRSAVNARFEVAESMSEADKVLARYKEIYNGDTN